MVYDYVNQELGIAEQDIILFGRAIGSCPACFIAKERPQVAAMILMWPYKSIQEVVEDQIGELLDHLLQEDSLKNTELIAETKCPVLIINGKNDMTVALEHSQALQQCCGSQVCKLVTPVTMDHNNFNFEDDLI